MGSVVKDYSDNARYAQTVKDRLIAQGKTDDISGDQVTVTTVTCFPNVASCTAEEGHTIPLTDVDSLGEEVAFEITAVYSGAPATVPAAGNYTARELIVRSATPANGLVGFKAGGFSKVLVVDDGVNNDKTAAEAYFA